MTLQRERLDRRYLQKVKLIEFYWTEQTEETPTG